MVKGSTHHSRKRRRTHAEDIKKAIPDNPFEKRSILRKKHEVFNRRVSGEQRNVAKARSRALERRQKTLLSDYERSQKANSFLDRRFGEDDSSLLVEEKMWARMQKDRKQRSRKGGMFNLEDGEGHGEVLTHKGQTLDDDYEDDEMVDSDGDDNLNAEVVGKLHFGGGAEDANRGGVTKHKSRKDVLDEIIAKSKAYKLDKARSKDEQEGERERLDEGLGELLGILNKRPTKNKGAHVKGEVDDYNQLMRELVYEAKAQATDRLKTPEETAKEEKAKLDELEEARVKRMSGEAVAGSGQEKPSSRRERVERPQNDDELGEEIEEVHNSHFLEAFSGAGGSGGSESSDGEESGGDLEDDGFDFEESTGVQDVPQKGHNRNPQDGSDDSSDESEEEADALELSVEKQSRSREAAGEEIPYVLDCPTTYEELLAMLAKYAKSADDINTIMSRIHKNHSIKLDSKNKERVHNFYDVLLKRFRRVGDQAARLPAGGAMDRAKQLDFLSGLIYDVTSEMPDVAASLWHRMIGGMQKRMVKAINDEGMGSGAQCWPSWGSLLLLKLLVDIFPPTDFRHPVVTPTVVFLSQCLSQCPVKSSSDLGSGLFCCALLLHYTLGANRLPPEGLVFLTSALANFAPSPERPRYQGFEALSTQKLPLEVQQLIPTPSLRCAPIGWLRSAAGNFTGKDLPVLDIMRCALGGEGTDKVLQPSDRGIFAVSALSTIYKLIQQAVMCLRDSPGLKEILQPVMDVMDKVGPKQSPKLCAKLDALHLQVLEEIKSSVDKSLSRRQGLQWQVMEVKTLNALAPKFQESYKMKKDSNKDPEQAKVRQLQRQVKRERKGAMRELKRDAVFLEQTKMEKKQLKDNER
ncbi:unnamed protein product [Choristocarpus tenellus]